MINLPMPLTGRMPPPGWKLNAKAHDGARWIHTRDNRIVIASYKRYSDGKLWLHVSLSRPNRVPSYDDLVYVKRHWIGDDRKAIMVLPSKDEHVNLHPYVLHLFTCIDGDPLPDFRTKDGIL